MDTDIQKTNQGNLDFLAAPLEPKKREALELVCVELGLDREAFECIEFEARMLRDFETHGKAYLKTPREKIKALQKVEDLANALHEAMQEFNTVDQLGLWQRMPESMIFKSVVLPKVVTRNEKNIPKDTPIKSLYCGDRFGRVGHISLEVKDLANAAHDERVSMGDKGKAGGRKATLGNYALRVAGIWDAVKETSIPLGRGGAFEKLCNAVFKAADIHASPEGAIREFMRWGDTEDFRRSLIEEWLKMYRNDKDEKNLPD